MLPADVDPPTKSTCTSCTYSEDFSNYWTANIYFRARNGSFRRVPQVANTGLKVEAGMTVYYIRGYTPSQKVTAFKPVSDAAAVRECPAGAVVRTGLVGF